MKSHWVLMTKDVIPDSRNKKYKDQKALVTRHASKAGIPYKIPNVLQATTSILMHYVETREALYTDGILGPERTFTRCQEDMKQHTPAIGNFSSKLLRVLMDINNEHIVGVACCWCV